MKAVLLAASGGGVTPSSLLILFGVVLGLVLLGCCALALIPFAAGRCERTRQVEEFIAEVERIRTDPLLIRQARRRLAKPDPEAGRAA
jgi:hypothetical protein